MATCASARIWARWQRRRSSTRRAAAGRRFGGIGRGNKKKARHASSLSFAALARWPAVESEAEVVINLGRIQGVRERAHPAAHPAPVKAGKRGNQPVDIE